MQVCRQQLCALHVVPHVYLLVLAVRSVIASGLREEDHALARGFLERECDRDRAAVMHQVWLYDLHGPLPREHDVAVGVGHPAAATVLHEY